MTTAEHEEREYLEVVKEKLLLALRRVDERVREFSDELRQNKEYIYEHQSGLDEADMVAAGQSINRMAFTGESAVARKRKLQKLLTSPYFGRIDFQTGDTTSTLYIGIYTFFDETSRSNVVFDWRAPIASMFYDFELGSAFYQTPSGKIDGTILLKRQYKIREGKMEFMIENGINIHDDILQKELSKSSDDKMKNIVATIQRDQNAIIRNEEATVMIIQGVAGSGKTSIALHRIAFLLYRFRESIRSKDVLILSPNRVFADYISNVLPELGEEHIPEMGMEDLASDLLAGTFRFQSFFQQVAILLERADAAFVERIQFKASFAFLSKLNQYLIHLENNFFEPTEIRVAGIVVPWPFILQRLKAYHRIPLLRRFPEVTVDIQHHVRDQVKRKLSGFEKMQIREALPRMVKHTQVMDVYRNFYQHIGRPELFRFMHNGALEYSDVFPFLYCKIRLEGAQPFDHVKHLLVDEMQDYTPVQYAVLSRIFKCNKTILGDSTQQVNPFSATSADVIQEVFPLADTVKLVRSYRSTWEITQFAQRIVANPDVVPMERHGDQPVVKHCLDNQEEIHYLREQIEVFKRSSHRSLGIICKTIRQAETIGRQLNLPKSSLLSADSTAFHEGIIITCAHLAKGLEFDQVIVPGASARNYASEVDRRMLYIACTRAMHALHVTYTDQLTSWLK